jgi:hypothetical protein
MNREDFEPFMIDKSFDKFIHILSKDGTFSGNECLVAFQISLNMKLISYHNFEHYSSVRKLDDDTPEFENNRQLIITNEYDIDYIQS